MQDMDLRNNCVIPMSLNFIILLGDLEENSFRRILHTLSYIAIV